MQFLFKKKNICSAFLYIQIVRIETEKHNVAIVKIPLRLVFDSHNRIFYSFKHKLARFSPTKQHPLHNTLAMSALCLYALTQSCRAYYSTHPHTHKERTIVPIYVIIYNLLWCGAGFI